MNRKAWNATMATDQTDGDPPSRGSTILVNIGWTANSRSAEKNSVAANKTGADRRSNGKALEATWAGGAAESNAGMAGELQVPGHPRKIALNDAYAEALFNGWAI